MRILKYVEDLDCAPNKEIRPKDFSEMASNKKVVKSAEILQNPLKDADKWKMVPHHYPDDHLKKYLRENRI